MFIQLRPAVLEVVAGSSTEVEITVIDPPSGLSQRLEVMLAGIEPEWVTRVDSTPADMVLTVGDGRLTARLAVSVPADHPAGERLLAVGVRPESDRRGAAFERLPMSVVDRVPIRVSTDPSIATGGRPAVRLVIANDADREIVVKTKVASSVPHGTILSNVASVVSRINRISSGVSSAMPSRSLLRRAVAGRATSGVDVPS